MQKSNYKINSRTYLINYTLSYIFFPIAVWPLIYGRFLNFSQIGMIVGVSSLVQTVLELPSGALADLFGRRNIIILAKIIRFISYLVIVLSLNIDNVFLFLMLGEVLWKTAEAFASGSEQALIYDSLKENRKEEEYEKLEAQSFFYYNIFHLLAAIIGGFLYEIDFRLPFVALLIPALFSVINSFFFQEPILDSEKYSLRNYIKQNILGFKHIFRNKIIFLISFYSVITVSTYMIGTFLLYQQSVNEMIAVPKYVGLVAAGLYLSRAIASWIYSRIYFKINKENFAIFLAWIQSASSFLLIVPFVPIAILGLVIRYMSDGFRKPYLTNIQNQYIKSTYRATAISAIALLVSLVSVLLSPLVGYGIDLYNARVVIAFTGFFAFIALPVAMQLKKIIRLKQKNSL